MNSLPRHHAVTIGFHWFTVILLCVSLSSVWLREFIDDEELRLTLINFHRSVGMLVLIIVSLRLLARLKFYVTHVSAGLPKKLQRLASVAHGLVYLVLFALPMSGWLLTSTAGKTISFFGLFTIPKLIAKNRELHEQLGEVHETLAYGLLILIAAHVAAALWHHFVRKDHILLAILPKKSAGKSSFKE